MNVRQLMTNPMHEVQLAATWRLIKNLPDSRFRAELTLRNDANLPLAPPWELYFNSSRRIDPQSIEPPLGLRHVNGDLYVLRADQTCPPIDAQHELVVQLIGSPWAINVSDAPSGFYLVLSEETGIELPPICVPREINTFPVADVIRRGADDQIPVVTSEARFEANENLQLLSLDELPPVLPTPVHFKSLFGQVTISSTTVIVYKPPLDGEARFLAKCLLDSFDLDMQIVSSPHDQQHAIRVRLGDVSTSHTTKQSGSEAYFLAARPDTGIEIVGTGPAGVFYGIQTLRGLFPVEAYRRRDQQFAIAAVEITDAPRFGYRGLHLDVARNFQSVDTVKNLLDLMAFYKLNRFHWHLTDDEGWRIEIEALPELVNVGGRRGHTVDEADHLIPSFGSGPLPAAGQSPGSGFYSQKEIIDVLRFASERHITVIPELDFPGHARAAIKAIAARAREVTGRDSSQKTAPFRLTDPDDTSKYESAQMWRDNVVDVCQESTTRFLDLVVKELADMYRRAGLPLECVHLGGDEVPDGAWEASPSCQSFPSSDGPLTRGQQLQLVFMKQTCDLLAKHNFAAACWEDCLLLAEVIPENSPAAIAGNWSTRPTAYVWNNVWGWGREDAAYRLANAGYDVVLSNATHLYFDLACEKDPLEPGDDWAGFVDTRAPFEFNPLDVFQNARADSLGQPLTKEQFADRVRLSRDGREHILGIQGQLWGENLRSAAELQYMAFPRTIALAERAWSAEPKFARCKDIAAGEKELARAWNEFANCLGQRELPRLDYLAGGVGYRIPPPGAKLCGNCVWANVALPGLVIRYSTDGCPPTPTSARYEGPIAWQQELRLGAFSSNGRGSRTIKPCDKMTLNDKSASQHNSG